MRPAVKSRQVSVDAHPAFARGLTCLSAVFIGITKEELREKNVPLYTAICNSLQRYGGEVFELPEPRLVTPA